MQPLRDNKGEALMNGISDLLRRHTRELSYFLYFLHVVIKWPSVNWKVGLPRHWRINRFANGQDLDSG